MIRATIQALVAKISRIAVLILAAPMNDKCISLESALPVAAAF